jgi:hypothetical protein
MTLGNWITRDQSPVRGATCVARHKSPFSVTMAGEHNAEKQCLNGQKRGRLTALSVCENGGEGSLSGTVGREERVFDSGGSCYSVGGRSVRELISCMFKRLGGGRLP